ncbi:MAG: hypothetical protein WCJ54_07385 [Actinomycetota bacterium]
MSRLIFIQDKQYDSEMIYHMLNGKEEVDYISRRNSMEIPERYARRIADASTYKDVGSLIRLITEKRYMEIGVKLSKKIELYQKSWDQMDSLFFTRLTRLTNMSIQFENYYCVVSAFHTGISNWGGNKIARHYDEDPLKMRRTTAHELIISHIFAYMHKKHRELTNHIIWQLAEVYAFAVIGLDKVMTGFWPWDKIAVAVDHDYPELVPLQNKLNDVAIKGPFEKYITEGTKILLS